MTLLLCLFFAFPDSGHACSELQKQDVKSQIHVAQLFEYNFRAQHFSSCFRIGFRILIGLRSIVRFVAE